MMAKKLVFLVVMTVIVTPVQLVSAQDKAEGKKIYLTYCAACHGESGKGDGLAAGSMPVKPADHTNGEVMNKQSDQFLFEIVSKGGAEVQKSPMMPGWGGQLKENQIRDVIAYIRSLATPPYKPPKQ
jgi:mono/diheme cytochrome c family protein